VAKHGHWKGKKNAGIGLIGFLRNTKFGKNIEINSAK
jgi:hypothetical protein